MAFSKSQIPFTAQHYLVCGTEDCEENCQFYCNPCHRPLCEQCRDEHQKSSETKNHEVVPYQQRKRQLPEVKCHIHVNRYVDMLCEQCQVPVCSKCAIKDHGRHTFIDLETVYAEKCATCLNEINNIEEYFLPISQDLLKSTKTDSTEIKKIMESIRTSMRAEAESLKGMVDAVTSDNIKQVNEQEKSLLQLLKSQDKKYNDYISYLNELVKKWHGYLSSKNFQILKNEITKNLKIDPIPETTKPVPPVFTAGQYSKEDVAKLLGRVTVPDTKPEIRKIKPMESLATQLKPTEKHSLVPFPQFRSRTLYIESIRASDLLYKDESKDLTPILYIVGHPEDITQPSILEEVSRLNRRTFIVVDEAHLVPQWGEEFRPMFRNICNLKSINSHLTSILALTATASVKVQKSIASHLTMKKPVFLRSLPVLNSNIKMTIQERPSSTGGNNRVQSAYDYIFKPVFINLLMNMNSFPLTIIYSKLKWCAYGYDLAKRILKEEMYNGTPCPENSRVVQYHSTQPENVNSQIIEDLKSNKKVKVVLATVALGMGADLRNVKHVIHAGPPTSPEVYVQEVGRAGRDGQAAEAKLYFNNSDLAEKPIDNSMIEFIRSKSCRRQHLSAYFDAPFESVDNCCDVCCKEGANVIGFKVPSLEQRHYVRLSLQTYINADPSGELGFIMSEEKVQIIVDCFEFIKDESYLSKLLNSSVPESVSSSLFAILSSFQND